MALESLSKTIVGCNLLFLLINFYVNFVTAHFVCVFLCVCEYVRCIQWKIL